MVAKVSADLEGSGRRFCAKDNGQAMVLFFLDEATAKAINRHTKDALEPVA